MGHRRAEVNQLGQAVLIHTDQTGKAISVERKQVVMLGDHGTFLPHLFKFILVPGTNSVNGCFLSLKKKGSHAMIRKKLREAML